MKNLYTQLKDVIVQCLDTDISAEGLAKLCDNLIKSQAVTKEERKQDFLTSMYREWVTNSSEYSSSELLARYVTWTMAKTHPDWTLRDCEKYLEAMTQTLGPDTDNFAKNGGYVTSY